MSTNEYIRGVKNCNWQRFNRKLWQRNYYEIIIRNEDFHNQVSEYIVNNPLKWDTDKYYICLNHDSQYFWIFMISFWILSG
ncbi:MAG: hypothetical protein QM487_01505 [Candidatus Marithrix sp.]